MSRSASDTRHRVKRSSSEQDRAAGSREARLILTDKGKIARASVELKKYVGKATTYWAYLRWGAGGKTFSLYLGQTQGRSRARCLRNAWNLARARGLIGDDTDTKGAPPTATDVTPG